MNALAVQADGKILLGGWFTKLQPNSSAAPTTRQHIARLKADGSLDMAFDPVADDHVWCIAVQADGKILIGEKFTTFHPNGAAAPIARNLFARMNNTPPIKR